MSPTPTDPAPSSDPATVPGTGRRAPLAPPLSRPLGEIGPAGARSPAAYGRPRIKMLETEGDLTPAGATHTPPTPAPLPERGTGIHLFLAIVAALTAVIFLVLLLQKV